MVDDPGRVILSRESRLGELTNFFSVQCRPDPITGKGVRLEGQMSSHPGAFGMMCVCVCLCVCVCVSCVCVCVSVRLCPCGSSV